MRVEFKPCPDCGGDDYPRIERDYFIQYGGMDTASQVRAECRTCGWRTLWHRNVRNAADEWGTAKVVE